MSAKKKLASDKPIKLKTRVRHLLFEAMKKNKKRPCDIVSNTPHHASYVSKILKNDCNISLDTTENAFRALGYDVELKIKRRAKTAETKTSK